MPDVISGPVELVMFTLALVLTVWITIDPRRPLGLLTVYRRPLSGGELIIFRLLAGFVAANILFTFLVHFLGGP